MDLALALFANILIPGALFALVAAGYTLVARTTHIPHLAHGGVVLTSAYVFAAFVPERGLLIAGFLALMSSILLGLGCFFVYEQLRFHRSLSTSSMLMCALSLLLIIQNGLLICFGSSTLTRPVLRGHLMNFGPIRWSVLDLTTLILSTVLLVGLVWWLRRSRLGTAIRAVGDQETVAEIVGISASWVRELVFVIASALGAVAGMLYVGEYGLEPSMATTIAIRMFFRASAGGIGSIAGAIVGSMTQETVMQLTSWFVSPGWMDAAGFVFVLLVLLIRPDGIISKNTRDV